MGVTKSPIGWGRGGGICVAVGMAVRRGAPGPAVHRRGPRAGAVQQLPRRRLVFDFGFSWLAENISQPAEKNSNILNNFGIFSKT